MEKTPADALTLIRKFYAALPKRLADVRARVKQPLTLAEKILYAHWQDTGGDLPERGKTTATRLPLSWAPDSMSSRTPPTRFCTRWRATTICKARGVGWVAVGDQNYGKGSSREHAAMCPRHLGCRVVITRSFARIHETNLKKQGVLPLTFADPKDYERIQKQDRLSISDLDTLAPEGTVAVAVTHADGASASFKARHTLTADQIAWFHAGSALNLIRRQPKSG